MNFETTTQLIDILKPHIVAGKITTSTENKAWKGRSYKSDYVTIDERNNVGFEVFDNEIIVFYFTDHVHFENYTSELEEGEDDYIGGTWYGLVICINPFAKKTVQSTTWIYDKATDTFTQTKKSPTISPPRYLSKKQN